jgi:hypothetical protein
MDIRAMHIDVTNNINLAGDNRPEKAKGSEKNNEAASQAVDHTLSREYASALKMAAEQENDTERIKEAARALRAGELDSAEAAMDAARNILRYGI